MHSYAAPSATAYDWHLRSLLRALLDGGAHLLSPAERHLCQLQEALSDDGCKRLARLLQRVDPQAEENYWSTLDYEVLCLSYWCEPAGQAGALRVRAPARRLFALALSIADQGRLADLSLAVTSGLDGRRLPALPFARCLAGVAGEVPQLPWPHRQALLDWCAALAERRRPASESAWLRALSQVAGQDSLESSLLAYHLTADYQWRRRLQEVSEALPPDPRRLLATLRALQQGPSSPSLARFQARTLYRLLALRSWRREVAGQLKRWAIWHPGEQYRWQLRSRGDRRAAWPEVPSRRLEAWMGHDGRGGVVADGLRVEACALRQLHREGWQGIHAEGGFWLGLCALLGHELILQPVSGAWVCPWQTLPLDWARWGFSARRAAALDALAMSLVRDGSGQLESSLHAVGDQQFPGWPRFPDPEAARAVCRHLPGLMLARLLRRILSDPRHAAGLPDLVCWRGDEVALWEVKSPGDALSDGQRWWLLWLAAEGVQAGVLRVQARLHRQTSLLDDAQNAELTAPAPKRRSASRRTRTARSRRRQTYPKLQLLSAAGDIQTVQPGLPVDHAGTWHWAQTWAVAASATSGTIGPGAVAGWERPVDAIAWLRVHALRWQGIAEFSDQAWIAMPNNYALPLLIHYEASNEGGLQPVASVMWRRAGWLVAADACALEPVIAEHHDLRQETTGAGYDWEVHPHLPPPRPVIQAAGWGCAEQLEQQLELLHGIPHALEQSDDHIRIALPADSACLWIIDHPRLRRSVLPWRGG